MEYQPPKNAQELLERYVAGERYFAGAALPAGDFSSKELVDVNLQGAYLIDAAGLTRKQISAAQVDRKTRLPDYLRAPEPAQPKK